MLYRNVPYVVGRSKEESVNIGLEALATYDLIADGPRDAPEVG